MNSRSFLSRIIPAGLALAAPVLLATRPAIADDVVCQPILDHCVEVDGSLAQDARVYKTGTKGRLFLEIPSRSMNILLDLTAGKAVTVPGRSIRHEEAEGVVRLTELPGPDALASTVSADGPPWRVTIGSSDVRLLHGPQCRPAAAPPPVAASPPTTASGADDPEARKCLRLETKPIAATAGCTKTATLKNTCDAPVAATVLSTQHLFSGTLPQTTSIVVQPRSEHPLGCAWSSGATAPTDFTVLAAAFVSKPGGSPAGKRNPGGR
jgi:hypothetical protein